MKKFTIAAVAALTLAAAPALADEAKKKITTDPFGASPVVSTQGLGAGAGLAILGGLAFITILAAGDT